MCGIAGFVAKAALSDAEALIRRMTDAVRHRGPDGEGRLLWENCALGHRRLSILDLSEAGRQPMEYGRGRYAITFNGEIYNYIELRSELAGKGYNFSSGTDTEVILAAYDCWGGDCLVRFNGMWAFAILDREKREVFCARDRFGIKPFYYVDNDRVFAFGSEIKQLLDWLPGVRANREVMVRFLSASLPDFGDETFFEGVRRLAAGHFLRVDLRSGTHRIGRFYEVKPVDTRGASRTELVTAFRETFDNAVRLRLRSDVRVGTCLSGGLDSSSIAATAAAMSPRDLPWRFGAVTAQSLERETDETEFARAVVEASRLEWFTVRPTAEDANALDEEILWHQEEPVESGSQIMQYAVMRLARQKGITVLLDGQGADETLLGYPWYHGAMAAMHLKNFEPVQAARALMCARQQGSARSVLMAAANAGEQLFPGLRARRYERRTRYLQRRPSLFPLLEKWKEALTQVSSYQKVEVTMTSVPNLLRYEDKNSMAFGVETRLPFLDYRLVELALGLPLEMKIRDGWRKWVLREAMKERLPAEIAWRRGKIGFAAPDKTWRAGRFEQVSNEILKCELIRSVADQTVLREMLPKMPNRDRLRLYSVAIWAKTFGVC